MQANIFCCWVSFNTDPPLFLILICEWDGVNHQAEKRELKGMEVFRFVFVGLWCKKLLGLWGVSVLSARLKRSNLRSDVQTAALSVFNHNLNGMGEGKNTGTTSCLTCSSKSPSRKPTTEALWAMLLQYFSNFRWIMYYFLLDCLWPVSWIKTVPPVMACLLIVPGVCLQQEWFSTVYQKTQGSFSLPLVARLSCAKCCVVFHFQAWDCGCQVCVLMSSVCLPGLLWWPAVGP